MGKSKGDQLGQASQSVGGLRERTQGEVPKQDFPREPGDPLISWLGNSMEELSFLFHVKAGAQRHEPGAERPGGGCGRSPVGEHASGSRQGSEGDLRTVSGRNSFFCCLWPFWG